MEHMKIRGGDDESSQDTSGGKMGFLMVKLSLCLSLTEYHAIEVYWGSGCVESLILNLRTRWR
jgi:hypothetical protein